MCSDFQKYLSDYHYLSPSRSGNHDIKTALKNFQKFFGLPVTGELDEETLYQMKKPRCGVPDVDENGGRLRIKRFSTWGKWRKTDLKYYLSFGEDMSEADQARVMARAFQMWSAVASKLKFTRTLSVSNADFRIRFTVINLTSHLFVRAVFHPSIYILTVIHSISLPPFPSFSFPSFLSQSIFSSRRSINRSFIQSISQSVSLVRELVHFFACLSSSFFFFFWSFSSFETVFFMAVCFCLFGQLLTFNLGSNYFHVPIKFQVPINFHEQLFYLWQLVFACLVSC